MSKFSVIVAAVMFLAPLVLAKQKPKLPHLLTNARYVLVTTLDGNTANQRVFPDDRQALTNVQNAIEDWGHYKLAYKRDDADLIFIIRKGRSAATKSGIQVHSGSQWPTPTVSPDARGDIGDPLDTLTIYDAHQGIDSPPLWRGRLRDGLNSPDVKLVQQLRTEVEGSLKKP